MSRNTFDLQYRSGPAQAAINAPARTRTEGRSRVGKAPRRYERPPMALESVKPFWSAADRNYFAYRLILTGKLMVDLLDRSLSEVCDLAAPQLRVIAQLGLRGQGTVRSMAEGACVDRAEVSRATQQLLRKRVVRVLPHAADGRCSVFALSARGRRIYEACGERSREVMATALGDVSQSELAAVDRLHWQLASHCIEAAARRAQPQAGIRTRTARPRARRSRSPS